MRFGNSEIFVFGVERGVLVLNWEYLTCIACFLPHPPRFAWHSRFLSGQAFYLEMGKGWGAEAWSFVLFYKTAVANCL